MRINGVYVHTGIRLSKQLVLTEELFTDGVVNNNETKIHVSLCYCMQCKMYLINLLGRSR